MSMWVTLARVTPQLLDRIAKQPDILNEIFFDEKEPAIDDFDRESDVYGEDYRHMFVPYFEEVAEEAGGDPDDFEYDFCYGPAMYHDPKTVRTIADEWASSFSASEIADSERADVALFLFYKQAAEQGRAVICGIS